MEPVAAAQRRDGPGGGDARERRARRRLARGGGREGGAPGGGGGSGGGRPVDGVARVREAGVARPAPWEADPTAASPVRGSRGGGGRETRRGRGSEKRAPVEGGREEISRIKNKRKKEKGKREKELI